MTTRPGKILGQLTPLVPLDLEAAETVSDIVAAMEQCSFGARMLGEVAATLTSWAREKELPTVIYDGNRASAVAGVLPKMQYNGFVGAVLTSEAFVLRNRRTAHVLVVGHYSERHEDRLYELATRAIFINKDNQCRPGQVRDGFFPDVVFADPNFVMPVLNHVLLERVHSVKQTVEDLMSRLETMDGAGKEAVHGAHTLKAMLCDPDCTVFMTMSGAMTIAKMQRLPVQLIETGRIAYLAATGALIGHGLVEGSGCQHFKYEPRYTDEQLAKEGLNRVSDTIEPEGNFDHIEKIVRRVLQRSYPRIHRGPHITQSSAFYRDLGAYLHRHYPDAASVLSSAYRQGVAVVTPAVVDSELANDVFVENARRGSRARIIFDQELDTGVLFDLATKAKKLGIFTIGGGVPRNNTQNVAPLIEIYNERLRKKLPPGRFFYGCRIDPASMFLCHLSGCTYSEGVSWRKFDFKGMLAEVRLDATIVWPFIQKFAIGKFRQA